MSSKSDSGSPLTDVPGVGETTAERLRELGIDTAEELKAAYLTDRGYEIEQIRGLGANTLAPGVLEIPGSVPKLGPARWKHEVMAWVRLGGGMNATKSLQQAKAAGATGENLNRVYDGHRQDAAITPEMVDFDKPYFVDPANVTGLIPPTADNPFDLDLSELEPAAGGLKLTSSPERPYREDEEYSSWFSSVFYSEDGDWSMFDREYIKMLQTFLGFDLHEHPERVLVHEDGEYPLLIDPDGFESEFMQAPKIKADPHKRISRAVEYDQGKRTWEQLDENFADLDDGDQDDEDPDEWGPTMDTPVPEEEYQELPGGPDRRALVGSGLAPSDYELVNGYYVGDDDEVHPDDVEKHIDDELAAFERAVGRSSTDSTEDATDDLDPMDADVYDPTAEFEQAFPFRSEPDLYSHEENDISRSQVVTNLPGIGDASRDDLAGVGIETVGDYIDAGFPYDEVAPQYHLRLTEALLSLPAVDETDPSTLMQVFTGATNAALFDDRANHIGGRASVFLGNISMDDAAWAWSEHHHNRGRVRTDKDGNKTETVYRNPLRSQAALGTGRFVPEDVLPFDDLDLDAEKVMRWGHPEAVEPDKDRAGETSFLRSDESSIVGIYSGQVRVDSDVVAFLSALFGTDYLDADAFDHIWTAGISDRQNNRQGGAVVFQHPTTEVYAAVVVDDFLRPYDFSKAGRRDAPEGVAGWTRVDDDPTHLVYEAAGLPSSVLNRQNMTGVTRLVVDRKEDTSTGRGKRKKAAGAVWTVGYYGENEKGKKYRRKYLDGWEPDPKENNRGDRDEAIEAAQGYMNENPASEEEHIKANDPENFDPTDEVNGWELDDTRSGDTRLVYHGGTAQYVLVDERSAEYWTVEHLENPPDNSFAAPTSEMNIVDEVAMGLLNRRQAAENAVEWMEEHPPEEFEDDGQDATEDADDQGDDADDAPTPKHFGDYRRESVERLENTPHLEPIETFGSIEEMAEAIEEIHIPGYSKPPEKTLSKLRTLFERLPSEEAEREYLNDYKLTRTINSARKHFNEWVGKKKKYDQMPGWAEAGPSNYPKKKQNRLRDSERKAHETLEEKLQRLNGRTKGAFRRALKKAGTSEAELNAKKAEETTKSMRETLYPGAIVMNRDVIHGLAPWGVKRLNKKSVRLKRPERDGDGYALTTVDYDSRFLKHIPRDEIDEFDPDNEDLPEHFRDGYDSAIRYLMGDEWVDENLGDDHDPADTEDPFAGDDGLTAEERETIADAARDGDLKGVLSAAGLSTTPGWSLDWSSAEIETPADLVDHYDDRGDFQRVRGIGPSKSETLEEALPIIRDALDDSDDERPEAKAYPPEEDDEDTGNEVSDDSDLDTDPVGLDAEGWEYPALNTWRGPKANIEGIKPNATHAEVRVEQRDDEYAVVLASYYAGLNQTSGETTADTFDTRDAALEAVSTLVQSTADAGDDSPDHGYEVDDWVSIRWQDDRIDYDSTDDASGIWGFVSHVDGDTLRVKVSPDETGFSEVDLGERRVRQKDGNHQTKYAGDLVSIEETEKVDKSAFDKFDPSENAQDAADDDADADEGQDTTDTGGTREAARDALVADGEQDPATPADADAVLDEAKDADGELPPNAKKALSTAWRSYKQALKAGHEATEAVEDWKDERNQGARSAAIINGIRDAYGQDPINFDGIERIDEVDALSGEITPESTGFNFEWDFTPYDPTEEFK